LKGQIEVALNKPRRRPEYEEVLQGLASQVDRLIRLSNALLFLSHSDQDQLSQDCAILNLGNFLWPIIEEIQPLASEKGLALTANIPADLTLYGNADHLIRLFLNLLDNAVKYTPLGGQILVQAAAVDDDTQVIIHNSGPGISRKHLPHLFDRFYRVDADRSSMTGGSGLGLAIAREIVRLHGGTIGVESESGDGITFTVRLPRTKTLNHSLPFS
jgi:signal transduction histidine kinase